jgi:transposase-like protein
VAALHRALHPRHARPRRQDATAAGLRRDPPLFHAADGLEARERLGQVVDQLTGPAPKVAELLEAAEDDLLAFYAFTQDHWSKLPTRQIDRTRRCIEKEHGFPFRRRPRRIHHRGDDAHRRRFPGGPRRRARERVPGRVVRVPSA